MLKAVLCGACVSLAVLMPGLAVAQAPSTLATDVANLREDVRGLTQRVAELQLRVEQLETENNRLRSGAGAREAYATVAQLNEAVAEMNRTLRSAVATSKNETLQTVSVQMEKLAEQTNSAIDSIARGVPRPAGGTTTFTDDYPKEGIKYVVQRGDTIATIARKTGASIRDIMNANRISDPARLQSGQTLFIPGGR